MIEVQNEKIEEEKFIELITQKFTIRSSSIREDVVRAFRLIDTTKSKEIGIADFQQIAKIMGEHVTLRELRNIFEELHISDEQLSEDDFVNYVLGTDHVVSN